MKKTFVVLFAAFLLFSFGASAQLSDAKKNAKEGIKDKAMKQARKEAKKMKKEGWDVAPGSLPLDKALETSWIMQEELTEDGTQNRYITSDGDGLAGTRTAAEMQAIEFAKLQLAGQLETKIASLVSANVGNMQMNAEEAESVTEIVQSSKNIIAQELGVVQPKFKVYKKEGKNEHVRVRIFYDTQQAMKIAKGKVLKELKDKVKTNEEDLKKLMGM